jgi:hypothetical protein
MNDRLPPAGLPLVGHPFQGDKPQPINPPLTNQPTADENQTNQQSSANQIPITTPSRHKAHCLTTFPRRQRPDFRFQTGGYGEAVTFLVITPRPKQVA